MVGRGGSEATCRTRTQRADEAQQGHWLQSPSRLVNNPRAWPQSCPSPVLPWQAPNLARGQFSWELGLCLQNKACGRLQDPVFWSLPWKAFPDPQAEPGTGPVPAAPRPKLPEPAVLSPGPRSKKVPVPFYLPRRGSSGPPPVGPDLANKNTQLI